jgi:ABC-type antimicrobial peptide transport system permease subunit
MTAEEQSGRIDAYIARETIVSAVINGVIGALFFLAVFGTVGRVAVGDWSGYAFDFLPQSVAVALMACIVPGLIARRAQRTGRLDTGHNTTVAMPWLVRAASLSILSGLMLGTAVALAWLASGVATLDWPIALVIKIIYGVALGAWVTRGVLRRMVRSAALI